MATKKSHCILKIKHKIKKMYSWYKRYIFAKCRVAFGGFIEFSKNAFVLLMVFFSFLYIILASKMLLVSNKNIPYINLEFSSEYISKTGIMGSQITLTLICVSLIALVSNIENKYIYGEKLINLAFSNKGMLSFKWIMTYTFALLLANVFMMLKNAAFVYVALVFLVAIYTAVIILYRFAMVFLGQKTLKRRLFRKYYKLNLKHIKKSKTRELYNCLTLENLQNTTLKHLMNNNIPELNENMRVYFELLRLSFFNKPKLIQEFHTELINCQDLIDHINEIAREMLQNGKEMYGLRTYNALLKNMNYYKIIGTVDILIIAQAESFIDAFLDINNKTQLKSYLNEILNMNAAFVEQAHLQTTVDLSYCRLAQFKMISYHANSSLYEKTYDVIKKSKILSRDDKDELLERIRMNIISLNSGMKLYRNIDSFWNKTDYLENRQVNLDIIGEPLAKYLIRLIENNDAKNLYMFNSMFNNDENASFAKLLSILSILNILNKDNKREYIYDVDISENDVKRLFKIKSFLKINLSSDQIDKYYKYISNYYTINGSKNSNTASGGTYYFSPKLNFDKDVVDTYFAYLIEIKKDGNEITRTAHTKEYISNCKVREIINNLT